MHRRPGADRRKAGRVRSCLARNMVQTHWWYRRCATTLIRLWPRQVVASSSRPNERVSNRRSTRHCRGVPRLKSTATQISPSHAETLYVQQVARRRERQRCLRPSSRQAPSLTPRSLVYDTGGHCWLGATGVRRNQRFPCKASALKAKFLVVLTTGCNPPRTRARADCRWSN